MLLLIGLEYLGICTFFGPQCRGQHSPPLRLLDGDHGLGLHDETIAALDLACLGLRRTASLRPLYGSANCFHTIVQGMVTPEARCAAPASLPPAFIVDDSCLGVGHTGKPAGL